MPDSQPRLRILHLTAGSDAGGLSRYILDLCSAMRDRGHEVAVAGERGAWHDRFLSSGFTWIDAPLKGNPISMMKATGIVRNYIASHPIDLFHTHYRRSTLVARRVQKRFDVPILYTVHQPRIAIGGIWRWLTDFGDRTHVPSEDARRWLIDDAHVPEARITLIPHGVNPARFPRRDAATKSAGRAALRLSPDAPIAAFVGRLDVPKNAGWMLDVAIGSRAIMPSLKILIAGDGPEAPALRQRIAREGLADCVLLLGECDSLPVYQAADALMSPSEREGFSLACAEAMCVGVPVLRTRTGGAAEMIVEGETGRTVAADRAIFTSAALEFMSDIAALDGMGNAAAEYIRAHFSFERQVNDTIALYHRVIMAKTLRS